VAPHVWIERSPVAGDVVSIDNRRIAKIAKLAGAPGRKTAGVDLLVRPAQRVESGEPLYAIHAETPGELAWARDFVRSGTTPILIGGAA
jgi:thymidine phosphorylase